MAARHFILSTSGMQCLFVDILDHARQPNPNLTIALIAFSFCILSAMVTFYYFLQNAPRYATVIIAPKLSPSRLPALPPTAAVIEKAGRGLGR